MTLGFICNYKPHKHTQSQPFMSLIRYLLVSFFTPPYVHSCFSWKKVPIRCKLPIFFTVSYKACPLSSPWGVIIQKLAGCKYLLSPQHILVDTISYIIHGLLSKRRIFLPPLMPILVEPPLFRRISTLWNEEKLAMHWCSLQKENAALREGLH